MCGIAGILNLTEGEAPGIDALTRMVGALRHRGPDEFGLYRDERCGLGHARLSIIDVATGQQPLSDAAGKHWLAFNGEIFNYVELRAELQTLGHRFRTQSDTEVIVEAYRAWGLAAFARMNGQFALALWDGTRLILARDAVGILPLYLAEHAGRLYFASEVKAIFAADPNLPRRIDPLALEETFSFWTVVPPRALFVGVQELRPGHLRVYEGGRWREQPHVEFRFPIGEEGAFRGSPQEAAEAVLAALEEATRLRMLRADVPVGSYLSGGLDSSLVAALGLRAMGSRFQTFSLRFQDAEYDETGFQREMVRRLESDHHEVVVSRADIARVFPQVIAHTERPILRTAPAPLFLLSALVREHGIKVVLTGEGADEMFAGYDLFREAKVRRFWARAPQSLWRPRLLERLYPYLQRSPVSQQAMARQFFGRNLSGWREPGFSHDTRWHGTAALKRLFAPAVREAVRGSDVIGDLLASLPLEFPRWSFLAQDQYLEVRTLLSGYLISSQGDRMLMAHSVEGRFPFLDSEVIALANSLPAEYKLRGLDEKHVLKRAARDLVPDSILERKKQPYRAPDALSFVGSDAPEYVDAALRPEEVARVGLFDPEGVERLWRKCRDRREDGQFSNADNMAVVGVLSTQLLHQQLVDGVDRSLPSIEWRTFVDRLGPQS